MEWFERGFWDIAKPYGNNMGTVKQYLSLQPGLMPADGSPPLNRVIGRDFGGEFHRVSEVYHDYVQKAVTFNQFLEHDWDIIIASIPDHWETYRQLRDKFKPKAKLICQMGNMFNEISPLKNTGRAVNLMASTSEFYVPKNWNTVFYHQEMPEREFIPSQSNNTISSFTHIQAKPELFNEYKTSLPEFTFSSYGSGNEQGSLPSLSALYDKVQESAFVWQVKPGGDGFGWNWHTAFMLGRPVITNLSDYTGKLGERLFAHGITGFNLEQGTVAVNSEALRAIANSDKLQKMQQDCYTWYKRVVNYEEEMNRIKKFLSDLV